MEVIINNDCEYDLMVRDMRQGDFFEAKEYPGCVMLCTSGSSTTQQSVVVADSTGMYGIGAINTSTDQSILELSVRILNPIEIVFEEVN